MIVHIYDADGSPWICARLDVEAFQTSPEFEALEGALEAQGFEVCLDRKLRRGFKLPQEVPNA